MNKFFYKYCLAVCFIGASALSAQTYHFQNITVESGLSQPQVTSLFQDEKGVMWFGTNFGGITLYDGNAFEYITDKNGLADNVVLTIEKINHQLWLGTNNGLSIRDGKKMITYTTDQGLTHNSVYKIYRDKKGNTWLGTRKGVTIFKEGAFKKWDKDTLLNHTIVYNIFEDSKSVLWFSTYDGLFSYDGQSFKRYTSDDGMKSDVIFSVLEIKQDVYWILNGIGLYQLEKGKIKPLLTNYFLPDEEVRFYDGLKDRSGDIWIGCSKGVFKCSDSLITFFDKKNGLVDNNIFRLLEDREGNLWFASKENGVSKLTSPAFYSYGTENGLPNEMVKAIFYTSGNQLLMGTANGMFNFTTPGFSFNRIGLPENTVVTAIVEDKNHDIWIASHTGVYQWKDGKIKPILNKFDGGFNYCYDVYVDHNNVIWLATRGGVARVKEELIYPEKEICQGEYVYKIAQDHQQNYWFATKNGVVVVNPKENKRFRSTEGFTDKSVFSIIQGKNNSLWFGTSTGLYEYDGGVFYHYDDKQGLASVIINAIAVDSKGNLWLGLYNGLDKITVENHKIVKLTHYGIEEGFTGQECNDNSIYIDARDRVWVGTVKKLMVHDPHYYRDNDKEPFTRIKAVKLFGQPTDWATLGDSVDIEGLPVNLALPYHRNYLTFNFIGVSLTTPTKVKYQFMLKGIDNNWLPVTSKTEYTYSNIPPGNYEFLLKAQNGAGVWNKEPVSFRFHVTPPFWNTWWFYSVIGLVAISGIYSYVKIRTANKKILKQNEVIEQSNHFLEVANKAIAQQHKNIRDSINYSKRIQEAILPPSGLIQRHLPQSFIVYKPKDIVSGDFYWFTEIKHNEIHDEKISLIAAVDCTGHGVPGALVSIVGHNGLTRAVNEFHLTDTGEILDKLNELVEETLRQNDSTAIKDGMDIALCAVDVKRKQLGFSGANNPIYLLRKKGGKDLPLEYKCMDPLLASPLYDLYEIKGDKQPIGIFEYRKKFKAHIFELEKGDTIYMFSDGYADQFGGPKGKKFLYKSMKKLFLSVQHLEMAEQKNIIERTIDEWKGNLEQVDDILVVGFRI